MSQQSEQTHTHEQLIVIGAGGDISGLQRKPGQGVDLREFGKAEITRASEIQFDEQTQLWYVQVLTGKYTGRVVTPSFLREVLPQLPLDALAIYAGQLPSCSIDHVSQGRLLFGEYDDAVKFEIKALDFIRQHDADAFTCA